MISFVSLKKPSSRNYRSFRNWVWDRKPLDRGESRYIQNAGDDLVALSNGQEDGCFDGMVEDVLGYLPRPLVKVGLGFYVSTICRTFADLPYCSSLYSHLLSSVKELTTNTSTCTANAGSTF